MKKFLVLALFLQACGGGDLSPATEAGSVAGNGGSAGSGGAVQDSGPDLGVDALVESGQDTGLEADSADSSDLPDSMDSVDSFEAGGSAGAAGSAGVGGAGNGGAGNAGEAGSAGASGNSGSGGTGGSAPCVEDAVRCDPQYPRILNTCKLELGGWVSSTVCPYTCVNGACAGDCTPGDKKCMDPPQTIPQTCSDHYTWVNGTACPGVSGRVHGAS